MGTATRSRASIRAWTSGCISDGDRGHVDYGKTSGSARRQALLARPRRHDGRALASCVARLSCLEEGPRGKPYRGGAEPARLARAHVALAFAHVYAAEDLDGMDVPDSHS